MRPFDYDLMPRSVVRLADVIGWPAALKLVHTYGGVAIYVPAQPTDEIIELIGTDAAEKLCQHYYSGSDRLTLPRCVTAMRAAVHWRIVSEHERGITAARLARRYEMTERRVYQILAEKKASAWSGQAALFD